MIYVQSSSQLSQSSLQASRLRRQAMLATAALALSFACCLAVAQTAWGLSFSAANVNGEAIGGGQAVDVNVLQQGIYLTTESGYADSSASACETYWVRVTCNETGASVMTWNSTAVGGTQFYTFSGMLVPGYTYTLTVDYMYQPIGEPFSTDRWVLCESVSANLVAAGSSGAEEGDDEENNTQDPAPSEDDGGGSDHVDEADTGEQADPSESSTTGTTAPSQSTISPEVSNTASGEVESSWSTQNAPSDAQETGTFTSSGASEESQGSKDALETLVAAASEVEGSAGVKASDLVKLGQMYSVSENATGQSQGDAEDDNTSSALDLTLVGWPIMWLLLWTLVIGALPAGVLCRGGRFKQALRARSRLA